MRKLLTPRNLVILLLAIALFVVSGLLGLKVPTPVISLAAEPVLHIGSFTVTNSLLTAWVVMVLLVLLALLATRRIPKDLEKASNTELVPSGFQNVMEWVIESCYGLAKQVAGQWTGKIFPVAMTIFLFVLLSNWLGLLPGFGSIGILEPPHAAGQVGYVANGAILTGVKAIAEAAPAEVQTGEAAATEGEHEGAGYILVPFFRAPSTDLNFTLALALVTVFLTQYFGVKAMGPGYFKKFFDLSGFKNGVMDGVVGFFVSILELISEFAKIVSLAFRLFGNVFAGEVLLAVVAFLIPYFISIPFYGLEVFVGFMQALVFMMLTLVFVSLATTGHGSEEHH